VVTPSPATWAYVAMGSNLGDPHRQLRSARARLETLGQVTVWSSLYATEPVGGPAGQPEYLNAVVALEPDLSDPETLLEALLAIERAHGRERGERWGPRLIDLDLLAYGSAQVRTADDEADVAPGRLRLPHPRMADRAFVLVPFCEVANLARDRGPMWRHPLTGLDPCQMLTAVADDHDVRRSDLDW